VDGIDERALATIGFNQRVAQPHRILERDIGA
jgi:hypothetical protein